MLDPANEIACDVAPDVKSTPFTAIVPLVPVAKVGVKVISVVPEGTIIS